MEQLHQSIIDAVREAGAIVRSADEDKGVKAKSGHQDLVTRYDGAVQRFLEERLLSLLPEAGFLGEEDAPNHAEREWVFIVDPIDGTTNFIKGIPIVGISVGLARNGRMEQGVVYNPYTDEMFTARRGHGAFCNGKPISVTHNPMADGISFFGTSLYYPELGDRSFAIAKKLFESSLDVRRLGAASLDLCYVAAGRGECYFECVLSPWDYAAGSIILEEAGGIVTDMTGAPLRFDRKCSLAAANAASHQQLLDLIAGCG